MVALLGALMGSSSGCATAARYDGATYRGHGVAFRTGPVPTTWRRLEASEGLLAFRDDGAEATVLVNGRCGRDGDDVPLAALTQHLFLTFTERLIESEETVPFDGREARRTVLTARLDGVEKRFDVLVMKKDGCVYDLVLVTAPGSFERAKGGFDAFVAGFRTEAAP